MSSIEIKCNCGRSRKISETDQILATVLLNYIRGWKNIVKLSEHDNGVATSTCYSGVCPKCYEKDEK